MATDPAAATLLCCTESRYGSYDLSDLCFLRGDDEVSWIYYEQMRLRMGTSELMRERSTPECP